MRYQNGKVSQLKICPTSSGDPTTLGNWIDDLAGPVDLRTDNARFEFEYFAGAVNVPEGQSNPIQHRALSWAWDSDVVKFLLLVSEKL